MSRYSPELIAAALRAVLEARRRERPGADDLRAVSLARAIGVAYPTLRRYLRGQRDIPATKLLALLDHLKTSPGDFGLLLGRAMDPDQVTDATLQGRFRRTLGAGSLRCIERGALPYPG